MDVRKMLQAVANPKPKQVEVPNLGTLFVRRMTTRQLFDFTSSLKDADPVEASGRTLAAALVNEDGTPVFDYNVEADRTLLTSLPPNVAMDVALKFRELNRVGEAPAAPAAG